MKIFETPVLNVKVFSKVSIMAASEVVEPGKSAVDAAKAKLESVNPNTTILDFVKG